MSASHGLVEFFPLNVLLPLSEHKKYFQSIFCGRRGGLVVSALDSGVSSPGSSPGWEQCVVFLGKTLYSHSASLHPGV